MAFYTERLLPFLMERALTRRELWDQRVPSLRSAAGDVLEVGFGFGAAVPHYPGDGAVKSLVGIDPNPGMLRRAPRHIRGAKFPVRPLRARASALPFPAASFDTIVTHWTLCSVADLPAVLAEIRRVLRPGGRFLFLEHGLADDAGLARRQRLLTPLQRFLAGGCRLDVPIATAIAAAGFRLETLERYQAPPPGPRIVRQMYRGAARIDRGRALE